MNYPNIARRRLIQRDASPPRLAGTTLEGKQLGSEAHGRAASRGPPRCLKRPRVGPATEFGHVPTRTHAERSREDKISQTPKITLRRACLRTATRKISRETPHEGFPEKCSRAGRHIRPRLGRVLSNLAKSGPKLAKCCGSWTTVNQCLSNLTNRFGQVWAKLGQLLADFGDRPVNTTQNMLRGVCFEEI